MRSSVLPIPADRAFELARKAELLAWVVAPYMQLRGFDLPDRFEAGARASGRLWWLGVVPSWTHHLTLVTVGENEISTNEWGGPVRTWNHRLTFVALDESSCRYTDEIEVDDGPLGLPTRLLARLLFAHRHRRWRALARVLS